MADNALPLYKDTKHGQSWTQFHQFSQTPQLHSLPFLLTHVPAPYLFSDVSYAENAKGLARNSSSLQSYHSNFKTRKKIKGNENG